MDQLFYFIQPKERGKHIIALQTFFILAKSRTQYEERAGQVRERLAAHFGSAPPPTNIVALDPEEGLDVVLELIFKNQERNGKVSYKSISGLSYAVIDHKDFKEVFGVGMDDNKSGSIKESIIKAFNDVISILTAEGLSLNNIVRQWTYIENITNYDKTGNLFQHYQEYNEVRAQFYNAVTFHHGYPAATGIGARTGGVSIGFIAVSDDESVRVSPICNPMQADAHKYSELVLMGEKLTGTIRKSTPKFERAKLVSFGGRDYIFISGTASIVGEETLYRNNVEKQTQTTIENILQLFSKYNQEINDLECKDSGPEFSHLRIYVKHQKDIPAVKKICRSRLNSKSSLFLVSDICRDELLVEIEGLVILNKSS